MQWVRLWLDMPTDPKWRVISRKSGKSISDVIATYNFLMVYAANNETRGMTDLSKSDEIAASLDLEHEDIKKILDAMQGKVLDGEILSGWEKRQPAREDCSYHRVKKWRETQKEKRETQCNANETQCNAPDTDTDTDTDKENIKKISPESPCDSGDLPPKEPQKIDLWPEIQKLCERYTLPGLINDVWKAIETTRKSGKIADSIKLAELKYWDQFSVQRVQDAITIYLDRECHIQGQGEKYLRGIMRNENNQPIFTKIKTSAIDARIAQLQREIGHGTDQGE